MNSDLHLYAVLTMFRSHLAACSPHLYTVKHPRDSALQSDWSRQYTLRGNERPILICTSVHANCQLCFDKNAPVALNVAWQPYTLGCTHCTTILGIEVRARTNVVVRNGPVVGVAVASTEVPPPTPPSGKPSHLATESVYMIGGCVRTCRHLVKLTVTCI